LLLIKRRKAMFSSLRAATLGLILAAAAITVISLPAQASDPLTGKWELNLAKSKFTNVPAPKSETRTYEVTGQQDKMIAERITADGKPVTYQYTANLDSKDYSQTGHPLHDTISLTPVDALTTNCTHKKAGKVVGGGTRVISKDGKTMTISFNGTNPKGEPMEVIFIFDKR
jgi:hypothetical protein